MVDRLNSIREVLLAAYHQPGFWGVSDSAWPLPPDISDRGSDIHLAYLTLVFTISGGREPAQLWMAARETFGHTPALFDTHQLAYSRSQDLAEPLEQFGLTRKTKSEAAVWQRIGQALVMRAGGSVSRLLAAHAFEAGEVLNYLQQSKTTFPVLSGPQTGPRWLAGLARVGGQPIAGLGKVGASPSPSVRRALTSLDIPVNMVSAPVFDALDLLGRRGCRRRSSAVICPAAEGCPVARFCQYGHHLSPD